MKRNHKLYEPECMCMAEWAFAYRTKIQWKPNHTKEKRSSLDAVDEGCSIEEISWDIFQLAKWMKQAESSVRKRKRPTSVLLLCNSSDKMIFFFLFGTENINLYYSIRHNVRHTTLYIHFIRPFFILIHVQKMPISNLCLIQFTVVYGLHQKSNWKYIFI